MGHRAAGPGSVSSGHWRSTYPPAASKPLRWRGGENRELLSICQLVSVADKEGSGCNDAEARGPPTGHRSNRFERYATGHFHGPHCCVKTPFPIPCFLSTNSWNGLFGLGRARASSRARLSVWKACFIGSVQVQFVVYLFPSYKGRAFSANLMIHSLQYPAVPRNSLTWRGVLGSGICNIVSFMA